MTADRLATAANENLVETYRAIGAAGPNPEFWDRQGVLAVRSPLRHPISNFAILPAIEFDTLEALREWIVPRPVYNVYTFAEIGESPDEATMNRCGFRHSSMLTTLAKGRNETSEIHVRMADGPGERLAVGEFIAEQFFPRQSPGIKSIISHASAGSGIPLAWLLRREQRVGALMLHDACGVAGIYNFCIERSLRGRGFGRQSLQSVVEYANQIDRRTVLQCEPSLVGWYESCGYEAIAHLDVWGLDITKDRVIMESG